MYYTVYTEKSVKPPGCSLWAANLISGTRGWLWSDNHRGRWSIVPVRRCVVWAVRWTAQPAWSRGVSWACLMRCYTCDPRHLTAQLESAEGKKYPFVLTAWKCCLSFVACLVWFPVFFFIPFDKIQEFNNNKWDKKLLNFNEHLFNSNK